MMQMVIEIPEEWVRDIQQGCFGKNRLNTNIYDLFDIIAAGKALPGSHGRLVDADAYEELLLDESLVGEVQDAIDELGKMPTILEERNGTVSN